MGRRATTPDETGGASRVRWATIVTVLVLLTAPIPVLPAAATERGQNVTRLTQDDFAHGTYIIDRPGVYRLAEDIRFNPNSPSILTAAIGRGDIPSDVAELLGLPSPVDAYHAGMPLPAQFLHGEGDPFTPGGPTDPRYDPAAYGVGFFAALAVQSDGVVIDLNGHRIEQSAEHALLQRFFAVIELADQPFLPEQGPAGFGADLRSATNVVIKNGTIGRSSHHGIHGNANDTVTVENVDFDGYEVGAISLNGVRRLRVREVTATNRKDVPVLGTFSSAMFIKPYIDDLVRTGSATTLEVAGEQLTAVDVQTELRNAINNTHHDVIVDAASTEGRIDATSHPIGYALFHNEHGVVDGNSYSFLINSIGVAVGGFPTRPDGVGGIASEDIRFDRVHVLNQRAFINEVPALDTNGAAPGGAPIIDPVGAVFQTRNVDPRTGMPITISTFGDDARYTGNPVANAQAFVAKAVGLGDLGSGRLDTTRLNMPESVLRWVEAQPGSETLGSIGATYLCNGDSMFHVNKGAIGFKIDAARDVDLTDTSVIGLANLGAPGQGVCGDYSTGRSHPDATLYGYGGAAVRAYTFAGSVGVKSIGARAVDLTSASGAAIGFAVMTDTEDVLLVGADVQKVSAGFEDSPGDGGPDPAAYATGFAIGADARDVAILRACARELTGYAGSHFLADLSGQATVHGRCPSSRNGE